MFYQQSHVPPVVVNNQEDGTQNVFVLNEELGHGSFATVYRVIHQKTSMTYAMKVLSKEQYSKSRKSAEKLKNEIEIQNTVDHPNIVGSKFSFSDQHNHYLILEYCPGKTIREYLRHGRIKESETRKILKDVIQGVAYLHDHQITHYDLKLENFIIDSSGNVKIADFGLSVFQKNEEGKKYSICGTPNYLCPEVLSKESREESSKVDIWTIGVSAFIMLTGKGPFEGATREMTFENIRKGEFDFPQEISISEEAKDFIKTILQADPRKRPTAKELLNHPFLTKIDNETVNLYRSNNLPQLNRSPRVSQKVQNAKKCLPQITTNSPRQAIVKPVISPRQVNLKASVSPRNDNNRKSTVKNSDQKKSFNIPNNFISRACFYKDDLGYLLGDGTVGMCFKDRSCIVMDPNEQFVQIYKNQYSNVPEVVQLFETNGENELKNVSLVKKMAKSFKKIRFSYDQPSDDYEPSTPLHFVRCFVKNDDCVLFKFNDKNLQVNFNDHMKLIIFWNTKKMCFFRSIKEKSVLLDLKSVASMNSNSEELKKFKNAKILLSNLALTIC